LSRKKKYIKKRNILLALLTKLAMKKKKKLPKSLRKYIRGEKARLRRQFLNLAEQEKQIEEMYKRILGGLPKSK